MNRFFASLRMTKGPGMTAAAVLLALCAVACGPKGPKVYHVSESVAADLGTLKEIDGPVEFTLMVFNPYQDTLYPKMIYTPCGCTSAKSDKTPVAPGEEEVIKVTYNPAYRAGKMREELVLYYQNSPVRTRHIAIMGEIIGYNHPIEESCRYNLGQDFYSSHKVLSYGLFVPGETKDMFFRYGNGGKRAAKVSFEVPQEWVPYIRIKQPGKMKADQRDTVHVKLTMPEGVDTIRFSIQPVINGKPTDEPLNVIGRLRGENE